jgi:hypothetical protein
MGIALRGGTAAPQEGSMPEDRERAHDGSDRQLVDQDEVDREPQLVADAAEREPEDSEESILLEVMGSDAEGEAAEEAAVRVDDDAPGATDDGSDGYVTEEGRDR